MSVIDKIIINKKKQLKTDKKKISTRQIKQEATDKTSTGKHFRFREKLENSTTPRLIAEYKPASPSQGNISNLTAEDVIRIYDQNDVDMISVLTEESYFKSSLENLQKAANITDKPLLRKDFIIDKYMIYQAAINGASAVLLINGVCPDMEDYINTCNNLGLDTIIECHTKEDIDEVIDLNPPIIGINNRNFNDLTVDLKTTQKLSQYIPNHMISESGVNSTEDVKLLKSYGADAVLIGTSILKNKTPHEIREYIIKLKNALK